MVNGGCLSAGAFLSLQKHTSPRLHQEAAGVTLVAVSNLSAPAKLALFGSSWSGIGSSFMVE